MKKTTFLKSILLLCALITGVGTAWAADAKVTYDLTSDWSVENGELTNGTVVITGQGSENFKMNSGYFMMGKNGAYITLPTYDFDVEKIVVTGRTGASANTKMNVYVGEDAVSTETTGCTSTNTYEIDAAYQAAGNAYTLKVSSNHNAQITKIEIYEKEGGGIVGPVDPSVSFENDEVQVEVGETVTNAILKPNGLTVTYASDKESVATVDEYGVVTGVAEGTATITASWAAVTDIYNAGSKSFTVTVVAATEATNYVKVTSASQILAGNQYILVTEAGNVMGAQNGTTRKSVSMTISSDKVKVKGEEVAVLTLGGTTDAWTFTASDNNTLIGINKDGNQLDASETNSKWKITDDFQVNNVGINTRYIQYNYNNGNERFAAYKNTMTTAYLYVKEGSATDTKADPELSYATTTYNVSFDEASSFVAPTLTNPHSLTVTYSSSDESLAIVDEATGEVVLDDETEGTVTITATFAGNEEYKAGSASYTITIYDPNVKGSIGNPYTVTEVLSASNAKGVYVKGYITGFYTNDEITTIGNTNLALAETVGDTDKDNNIAVQLPSGALRTAWNINDHDYIGVEVLVKGDIESYFSKQGVKSPTEISALSVPATVTEAGWATWVAPFDVEVPTGVSAHIVSAASTSATLKELLAIPANTPVLLEGEGVHRFAVCAAEDTDDVTANLLKVSDGTNGVKDYVLANHGGKVGFYQWTGEALAKGKVYLPADVVAGAPEFIGFGNGETTGIESVERGTLSVEGCFNLAGQRVAQPTKGLYIVNGKKYVVK